MKPKIYLATRADDAGSCRRAVNEALYEKGGKFHRLLVQHSAEEYLVSHLSGVGITAYLENKGTTENAQMIAQHKSPRTPKYYDRRLQDVALDEIERIQL